MGSPKRTVAPTVIARADSQKGQCALILAMIGAIAPSRADARSLRRALKPRLRDGVPARRADDVCAEGTVTRAELGHPALFESVGAIEIVKHRREGPLGDAAWRLLGDEATGVLQGCENGIKPRCICTRHEKLLAAVQPHQARPYRDR
eukprot:3197479-Prymnesium_polylepis.2